MMITTHMPAVTIPYPSVLPAGHRGQASWHSPVKGTFFLQAANGTWPCACHGLSGAYGHSLCEPLLGVRTLKAVIGRLAEP